MDRAAIFLAAVVPALLLIAYGIAKTRASWANEALWTAFFVGAVGALAATFFELALEHIVPFDRLPPLAGAAATALFVAAIPEETVKFAILVGIATRHVDARRMQDIIALGLAVSLGFAAFENLFYVAVPTEWQWIAAARAITAVPGHGINGLAMGALVTVARLTPTRQSMLLILALTIPVALHAVYDFPLFAAQKDRAIWLAVLWLAILFFSTLLAMGLCNWALSKAARADRALRRDNRNPASINYILVGCVMLIGGPLAGILALHLKNLPVPSVGAALGIVPVILGLDLMWTGIRRRRKRRRGTARK
jgi:protease PrsW